MNRVIALVEGQTERSFVDDVLAPWLGSRDLLLAARLAGKHGHKGGVGEYARARRDILALLNQESATFVTRKLAGTQKGQENAARSKGVYRRRRNS